MLSLELFPLINLPLPLHCLFFILQIVLDLLHFLPIGVCLAEVSGELHGVKAFFSLLRRQVPHEFVFNDLLDTLHWLEIHAVLNLLFYEFLVRVVKGLFGHLFFELSQLFSKELLILKILEHLLVDGVHFGQQNYQSLQGAVDLQLIALLLLCDWLQHLQVL